MTCPELNEIFRNLLASSSFLRMFLLVPYEFLRCSEKGFVSLINSLNSGKNSLCVRASGRLAPRAPDVRITRTQLVPAQIGSTFWARIAIGICVRLDKGIFCGPVGPRSGRQPVGWPTVLHQYMRIRITNHECGGKVQSLGAGFSRKGPRLHPAAELGSRPSPRGARDEDS